MLNPERVQALGVEQNAYTNYKNYNVNKVSTQDVSKVIFPEPYENASTHYEKNQFSPPQPPPQPKPHPHQQSNFPMLDIKSLLPMLMSGKMDILKPLMSMLGGGNNAGGAGMDLAKIFELFKPKSKTKQEDKKEEDVSSKFDDMIIIED